MEIEGCVAAAKQSLRNIAGNRGVVRIAVCAYQREVQQEQARVRERLCHRAGCTRKQSLRDLPGNQVVVGIAYVNVVTLRLCSDTREQRSVSLAALYCRRATVEVPILEERPVACHVKHLLETRQQFLRVSLPVSTAGYVAQRSGHVSKHHLLSVEVAVHIHRPGAVITSDLSRIVPVQSGYGGDCRCACSYV